MAKRLYSDGASATTLAINPGDTIITLNAGQGANFPSPTGGDYSILTLEDNAGNKEKIRLDSRTNDTLTVQRAQEGTTALTFPATTTRCELRITASAMDLFVQREGDDIDTEIYYSVSFVLANDVAALGEQIDLTRRNLIKVNASDQAEFGDAAIPAVFAGTEFTFPSLVNFSTTTATGKMTQSSGGSNPIIDLVATYGVGIEVENFTTAWQQGTVYTQTGAVVGGMGAVGTTGGAITRIALGVGATWYDGAQALTVDFPWAPAHGLNYGTNEVWHDGNASSAKTIPVGGDWTISAQFEFDTVAPTVNGGQVTSSPDDTVLFHVALTQAAYDLLAPPDATTLYYITD
jgi:hypothetical protein